MAEKAALIIFEDRNADGFYPLSVSHPVYSLLYGCFNIVERLLLKIKPTKAALLCRQYLAGISCQCHSLPTNDLSSISGDCLLINAALKPDKEIFDKLTKTKNDIVYFSGEQLIGGRLSSKSLNKYRHELLNISRESITFGPEIQKIESDATVFSHLWDLVNFNGEAILADSKLLGNYKGWGMLAKTGENARVLSHRTALIARGAYFDTTLGPIVIDKDATVEPRSVIQGPSYVGRNSRVMGGIIREGCSLGPVCKVGGELEESIILGFSNKCHEGFIGHSYMGEWVNLGAMTTNSDLKNNYTPISVSLNDMPVKTRSLKIGSFIGDHTKTGIGTLFNTGIVIGFCCNLYGGALFMQREIPHFSWGTPNDLIEFRLDKAIQVAMAAMARRKLEMNSTILAMFEEINRQKQGHKEIR